MGRPSVDLKQLTSVITVAETGSVTRAAQLLHLVQPAITRQIKALEHELGVTLFERSKSGMRLTDAGDLLVDRARRALGELERARAEITPDPAVLTGIVRVGLLDSMTDLLAEPLVTLVTDQHPGIELRLLTGYSGHLQRWLDDGDLDLTLLYNLKSTPTVNVSPVAREQLWVVAPTDAVLRSETPVDLIAAAAHPLVLPGAGHGLRTLMDEAAARAKVELAVVVETNSMRVQKHLVQAGHGWTILPGIAVADDIASGRLSAAPIDDPRAYRDIVLATPRTTRTPPAVNAVGALLLHHLHEAILHSSWPSAAWRGARPRRSDAPER